MLARMECLPASGHRAFFDEMEDPGAEEFAVHAQVFPIAQVSANRVGNAAEAHLDRRPVRHLRGDDAPDGLGLRFRLDSCGLEQRHFVFHNGVDFRHMQQGIAEHARHIGVYFHNQGFAAPGRRRDVVVYRAECEKTVFVHRGNGGYHDIHLHELPNQPRHLVKQVGDVVVQSDTDKIAVCRRNEPCQRGHAVAQIRRQIGVCGVTPREKAVDLDSPEITRPQPLCDRPQQGRGLR